MDTIDRDSFVVFRSYWEGIKLMPKEVQVEVYNALMEYGFTGNIPQMSDTAKGVFTLIRPHLDVSVARAKSGRKGGNATAIRRGTAKQAPEMTYDEEIAEMKANKQWNEPVCMQFSITPDELEKRLDDFSTHLKCTMDGTGHDTIGEAHRHFCSWMRKRFPATASHDKPEQPDYTYTGGFGGEDV